MDDKNEQLLSKLEDLVVRSKKFRQLERELAYFCPFEAVGMTDQEIRHAHFLSYILDPNRPHGFDDAFLRGFLHVAADASIVSENAFRPIDIHLMDLTGVRIERERDRIDLLIEIAPGSRRGGYTLVFELKINASEGQDQLQRYEDKMSKRFPQGKLLFFYLTLNGDDPSEQNRSIWTPISLGTVIDRFAEIHQRPIGDEDARRMVQAYTDMMRRRHVGEKNAELLQIASHLWEEHKEALEFLASNQPDAVSNALEDLFANRIEVCKDIADATGWDFAIEEISSERMLLFYPKELDQKNIDKEKPERRLFSLIVDRNYGDRYKLRFRWLIRPGNDELRRRIYDEINGKKPRYTKDWTQIFVDRMDIEDNQDWSDIAARLKLFVMNHQKSLLGLFQS